jgi:transposase
MDYGVYDVDFTQEGRRRIYLFNYLLSYSRRAYLRFVDAQDFTTTIREHVRAFTYLEGVAATCLYDNQKVVVMRHGRVAGLPGCSRSIFVSRPRDQVLALRW